MTLTTRGRTAGIAGLGACILALGTGYPALAFVGVTLLLSVAVAGVWTMRPLPLTAIRCVDRTRVSVNEPVRGQLVVTNQARRSSPAALGLEVVGRNQIQVQVPRLRPAATTELGYAVPTDVRGVLPVGPLRFVLRDPYGLSERSLDMGGSTEVLIRPHAHPLRLPNQGRVRALDSGEADRSIEGSLTFHALREYVPGDDRRRIHWRTSARTGTLMVKQHVDMTRPEVLVVLDLAAEPGRDFEELIEFAASVGTSALRVGHPVRLVTSAAAEKTFDGREGEGELLDALAVVNPVGKSEGSRWLSSAAARNTGSLAVICSVAASASAEAGRAMFSGRFGTVVCVGIATEVTAAVRSGIQVLEAPTAETLSSAWNSRFVR